VISIIVPYYNYGLYIQDTVSSICAQTYRDWECIIIDDCSEAEHSKTLHRVISKASDSRFLTIGNTVNMGYGYCKNVGISYARGDFIVHLDADDMLTPDSLEVRLEAFADDPELQFVHARAHEVLGNVSYLDCVSGVLDMNESRGQVHAQTWMLRRSVFDEFGIYLPSMRSKGDKEFLWRLGLCKKNVGALPGQDASLVKSRKLDKFVAYYRRHRNTMIRYRANHPEYNRKICNMFAERQRIYAAEGITRQNTPFLD
jgi:glycosyltransferase involved in cell wall biosynthesis